MSLPKEGSRDVDDGIIISMVPDIRIMPDGAAIPFSIWARQSEAANLVNSVRLTDMRAHAKDSLILHCYDMESKSPYPPNTGLGVKSGTVGSVCTPKTWSETVLAEGRNMVRHTDEWWMNNKNTYGKLIYTKDMGNYNLPEVPLIESKMPDLGEGDGPGTLVAEAPLGFSPTTTSPPPFRALPPEVGVFAPEALGAAGGLAIGGAIAGAGAIGIARTPGAIDDSINKAAGLPAQPRTPLLNQPLNLQTSLPGTTPGPTLPKRDPFLPPDRSDVLQPSPQKDEFGMTIPSAQTKTRAEREHQQRIKLAIKAALIAAAAENVIRISRQKNECKRTVTISKARSPEAAKHIDDAQAAGKPSVLTLDRPGTDLRRAANLAAANAVPNTPGNDKDEYPPATFAESTGASVRSIPLGDNRSAGQQLGYQLNYPDYAAEGCQVTIKTGP